jgi:hypothetical protein
VKAFFEAHAFKPDSLVKIGQLNEILSEYARQSLVLTVRQLYYQMVSRAYIPNNQREYKKLVALLTDARMAGLIDWDMLEDRNRTILYLSHWENPGQIVEAAHDSYRKDLWETQVVHVEVMLEKDALAGVLQDVCEELDVRLIPNRGYSSASTMYRHGRRLHWAHRAGKQIQILYLGDYDPSGLDMDRDILSRLELFAGGICIDFRRLALTEEQIETYNPPPSPAKLSDSRAEAFIAEHGEDVWELDALEPTVLRDLVHDAILEYRDDELWDELVQEQEEEKAALLSFVESWKQGHK